MPDAKRNIEFVINGKDNSASAFRSAETRLKRFQQMAGQAVGGAIGGIGGKLFGSGIVGGGAGIAAGAIGRTVAGDFISQMSRAGLRQLDFSEKLFNAFGIVSEKALQLADSFTQAAKSLRNENRTWIQTQRSGLAATLDRLGMQGGTPSDDVLFGQTTRSILGGVFGQRYVDFSTGLEQARALRVNLLRRQSGIQSRLYAQFVEQARQQRASEGGKLSEDDFRNAQLRAEQETARQNPFFERELTQTFHDISRMSFGRLLDAAARAGAMNMRGLGRALMDLGQGVAGTFGNVLSGVGLPPVDARNWHGPPPGLDVTEARFLTRGRDRESVENKQLEEIKKGNGFLQAMLTALTGKNGLEVILK